MSVLLSLFLAAALLFAIASKCAQNRRGGGGGCKSTRLAGWWVRYCTGMGAIVIREGIELTLRVHATACRSITAATHQVPIIIILLVAGSACDVLQTPRCKSMTLSKCQIAADWRCTCGLQARGRSLNVASVELTMRLLCSKMGGSSCRHHGRLLVHKFCVGNRFHSSRSRCSVVGEGISRDIPLMPRRAVLLCQS
jgi:hypothetical protein